MRENMRYAHYWQICARMFAITWHAWLAASTAVTVSTWYGMVTLGGVCFLAYYQPGTNITAKVVLFSVVFVCGCVCLFVNTITLEPLTSLNFYGSKIRSEVKTSSKLAAF